MYGMYIFNFAFCVPLKGIDFKRKTNQSNEGTWDK